MSDIKTKEILILRMMKRVLTDVAKETHARPGVKPPLTETTILSIRDCLALITARERELEEESGRRIKARPRFADQPQTSQVIQFHPKPHKKNDKGDKVRDD